MAGSSRSRGPLVLRAERERMAREVYLPVQDFIRTEWIGSGVLLAAAVLALVLANSPWSDAFHRIWESTVTLDLVVVDISKSLHYWVNDGLMALFFFVVGLEIKREILHGHLSNARRAMLPGVAALGGMAGPALAYAALNMGGPGAAGWGIPMATDIAFALGVLGLVGKGLPPQLRVFLLALAIVDDLGAILVIAVFYTETIVPGALVVGAALLGIMVLLRWLGVRSVLIYAVLAFFFWVAVLKSGVHATLAGVVLGLLTPSLPYYEKESAFKEGRSLLDRLAIAVGMKDHNDVEATLGQLEELIVGTEAPLERWERKVHPWTAFLVLPVFALANAGVGLSVEGTVAAAQSPVALGIVVGLLAGKLVGILGTTWLAVRLGLADLPEGVGWTHLAGVSFLAGIGFTVSLFISDLAFTDAEMVNTAKLGILVASAVAGVLGYAVLKVACREAAGRA